MLRGVAAALVVFHHMCHAINTYRPGASAIAGYRSLATLGASGVDVFFCISGLVIAFASHSTHAGTHAARTFAWRRFLRVIPPYWIYTAGLLTLWATGIGLKGLIVTPGLVAASLLLVPFPKMTISGDLSYHPILDVGWTLTYEMYFYAVCTLIIAIWGGRRIWPLILIGLVTFALLSIVVTGHASILSSIVASPLLLEFGAGVALAHFIAGRRSPVTGYVLVAVGTAALLMTIFVPDPMPWRVLFWGIPGVTLVFGALLIPISLSNSTAKFFAFLGTASYSIYLVHPFFLLPLGTLLKRGYFSQVPADLLLIAATLIGIAGSALSYFIVEGPLVQALKPRSKTAFMARESIKA